MTEDEKDATELVERIRAGDERALKELERRYAHAVSWVVWRNGGQSAEEELCQQTFVIVWQKIRAGELRETARLAGFICGVARNLALSHHRRCKKKRGCAFCEPSLA
jgi:DNA-directed RNA polymerase specialized sigma24 family protein